MIKECKVLSYNSFLKILVFQYNNKPVQTTATIDEGCKSVFVKYNNGKYEIVSKDEYQKSIENSIKKKSEPMKHIDNKIKECSY